MINDMAASRCRGCGRPIVWIRTTAGKMMPTDLGEITIVTKNGQVERGYIPHWATCPAAKHFRDRSGGVK